MYALRLASALLACCTVLAPQAVAQAYPSKPVRIILGQPPGGIQDTLARSMAGELAKLWNQPVTLDNRVGATGVVAAVAAARAAPDGYTIFFSTATNMNSAQYLQKDLPYHPEKDFVPVAGLGQSFSMLVAGTHLGVNTTRELVEKARASPGKLNYGTFGVASAAHFDTESFAREAGIKVVHVPFKSVSEAIAAMLAGHVDFAIIALSSAIPPVNSGKLKGLGYLGARRAPALPQVPTLAEAGYGKFDSGGMFALYVPAGTPQAVIDRIATDTNKARSGEFFQQKVLAANGIEDLPLSGAALVKRFDQSRGEFLARIKGLDLQLK
jgi:tripartite-type tricarboxylate transporter receptor subunit TctC